MRVKPERNVFAVIGTSAESAAGHCYAAGDGGLSLSTSTTINV
jgi:hypothetical protein